MGIREDRMYLKDRKEERNALSEAAENSIKEKFNNDIIERENIIASHEAAVDKYYAYKDNVKKTLLSKALYELCTQSIYNTTDREKIICENLIQQYVDEVGTSKMLKMMKFSESWILNSINENVDKFYKKITEGTTAKDPDTQTIPDEDIEEFWKTIDKTDDVAEITNTIRMRVSNAEEDFINKNQEDKENVKTILKQTADRVQNAKNTNDNDYAEAIEESETRLAKNAIYKIQHEGYHNVFDRMVRNISRSAMVNEDAKKEFIGENGGLDMDKIVESARCMYTILEMVSTIQLEDVDSKYIEETLKSI